jgi:hypothetical protein
MYVPAVTLTCPAIIVMCSPPGNAKKWLSLAPETTVFRIENRFLAPTTDPSVQMDTFHVDIHGKLGYIQVQCEDMDGLGVRRWSAGGGRTEGLPAEFALQGL